MPPEQVWIRRARETHDSHVSLLKRNEGWRIKDTAKLLKRSIGSIAEDLLIYEWLKTHEKEIMRCEYAHEAIAWIREKKHLLKINS